jgi:hypothetical protein
MRIPTTAVLATALLTSLLSAQTRFDRDMGTKLAIGDDTTVQGLPLAFSFPFSGSTYSAVCVCSNGYIWLGPTSVTGGDFTPSDADLRGGAPRFCPLWGDYNPTAAGSGGIYFKSLPDRAVISWANVYEYGTTNAVSFQVTMYPSGHVQVAYGDNPARGGTFNSTMLIGASQGGGAAANPISFAVRPLLTGGDTFSETLVMPGPIPYSGIKWDCSPAFPGFAISDMAVTANELPPVAKTVSIGVGCPKEDVTLYELFGNGGGTSVDVGGMEFTFVPNGQGGYSVSSSLPRPRAPGFTNDLIAGNETTHLVTMPFAWPHESGPVNQIVVSANGFVSLGSTDPGPGCCVGSVPGLLSGPARIAALWLDLNPAAAGSVTTLFDPIKNSFYVTWDAVPRFPNIGANTFHIAFEPSGIFRLSYSTISIVNGATQTLVGYSDGGGASDPGSTNLSAITSSLDLGAHVEPLTLAPSPSTRPIIGETYITRVTQNRGLLVYLLIGQEIPPIDLTPLGGTGCSAYVGTPVATFINLAFGAPASDFSIPIPLDLALAGIEVAAQSASDDPLANLLGWRVSNGNRLTIGL